MIADHRPANQQLMQLAAEKNVTLPTSPSDEQMELMAELQELSGEEFDRTYLERGGVDSHSKMEELFQTAVNESKDPDVQEFAAETLPVIQEHLAIAREMDEDSVASLN